MEILDEMGKMWRETREESELWDAFCSQNADVFSHSLFEVCGYMGVHE